MFIDWIEDLFCGKDVVIQREFLLGDKVDVFIKNFMFCLFFFYIKGLFCGIGFKCVIVFIINIIISIKFILDIKNFVRFGELFFCRCFLMSSFILFINMIINILVNNNSFYVVLKSVVISGRSFKV